MGHIGSGIEVHKLAEVTSPLVELVRQVRERLAQELQAQAAQIQRLEQGLQELRERHQQIEGALEQQLQGLEKVELPSGTAGEGSAKALEGVLGAVRNLMTATVPEQVLQVATEEAAQMGVRAAVFDVRGKAAWGSAASGFEPQISSRVLHALVVPLGQDNPFRQVFETGGHIDSSPDLLKKNRNILEKFKPPAQAPILLLPIRSGGAVSAIFYADLGGNGSAMPTDALKIVTEFAGAQLDRLMALSGGVPAAEAEAEVVEAEPAEIVEEAEAAEEKASSAAAGVAASAVSVEPSPAREEIPPPLVEPPAAAVAEIPPPAVGAPAPAVVEEPAPPPVAAPSPAPAGVDLSQLSEADQKVHKDAKRFAKLLISEIDLYNKTKVADGRKNKDLYKRLKSDIDRSRQTFEKRFGKSVAKQFDYFHEELVRTLAGNDPSLLGSDYPGPTA